MSDLAKFSAKVDEGNQPLTEERAQDLFYCNDSTNRSSIKIVAVPLVEF